MDKTTNDSFSYPCHNTAQAKYSLALLIRDHEIGLVSDDLFELASERLEQIIAADAKSDPLIETAIIRKNDKYHQSTPLRLLEAHWIASFAMDTARCLLMDGVPDGETSSGHMKIRRRTMDEALSETFELSERLLAGFEARSWTTRMPGWEELKTEEGQRPGFVTSSPSDGISKGTGNVQVDQGLTSRAELRRTADGFTEPKLR